MIPTLRAIHHHLRDGVPIPPNVGGTGSRIDSSRIGGSWDKQREKILRGGSANHDLIAHVAGMLRRDEGSIQYLKDRCRWELAHGLMVNEGTSPSYGAFHLGMWTIVAARSPALLARTWLAVLARTWLERSLAVTSTCSVIEGGRVVVYTPGQRCDSGGTHRHEGEMVEALLGLTVHPADTWGERSGELMGAFRALGDMSGLIRAPERSVCRAIIADKMSVFSPWAPLKNARLMVPMHYRVYGPDTWAAWIERGVHGQDPPWLATAYEDGEARVLNLADEKPAEGGWSGGCQLIGEDYLGANWGRKGEWVTGDTATLPEAEPLRSLTIGAGADTPAPPVEPTDPVEPEPTPGWPPPPLGPHDQESYLAKARAHVERAARLGDKEDAVQAISNLEAWRSTDDG